MLSAFCFLLHYIFIEIIKLVVDIDVRLRLTTPRMRGKCNAKKKRKKERKKSNKKCRSALVQYLIILCRWRKKRWTENERNSHESRIFGRAFVIFIDNGMTSIRYCVSGPHSHSFAPVHCSIVAMMPSTLFIDACLRINKSLWITKIVAQQRVNDDIDNNSEHKYL